MPVGGGAPVTICDVNFVGSASWGEDGFIVYGAGQSLFRVSADGGEPEKLIEGVGSASLMSPQLLPGGSEVLFTVGTDEGPRAAILSLETKEWSVLSQIGNTVGARYVPTGHLVYVHASQLLAVGFDRERQELVGEPVPVVDGIFEFTATGVPFYAVSAAGSLVYVQNVEGAFEDELVLVDRDGRAEDLAERRGRHWAPRFSPDGRRVALSDRTAGGRDIWIYDLERGARSRLTTEGAFLSPVWSPDSAWLAFGFFVGGRSALYRASLVGDGERQELVALGEFGFPTSWSPNGRILVFTKGWGATRGDIWTLSLEGVEGDPEPFVQSPFDERDAVFSPDGRWLAYTSDENGRSEVYVRPYPGPGPARLVSTDGGVHPVWSRDGQELFYRWGDRMMVAPVCLGAEFRAGIARLLFEGTYRAAAGRFDFDVSPDGEHFVMVRKAGRVTHFNVILNWFDELERLVPTDE